MEQGLRDCCRSIRIGKILIQSDEETHEAKVFYAKFPRDVHTRKVLLMYPIMSKYNQMYTSYTGFPQLLETIEKPEIYFAPWNLEIAWNFV